MNGTFFASINDVIMEDRSREDYGDIESLGRSIVDNGLLNAVVVDERDDGKYSLKAGGRRLSAFHWLNIVKTTKVDEKLVALMEERGFDPSQIEVKLKKDLSPLEALKIEFEENDKRLNPKWQERSKLVRRFHDLAVEENGKTWTNKETARELNLSEGLVSDYLKLTSDHPAAATSKVQNARTAVVARKQFKIERERQLKQEAALQEQARELRSSTKKRGAGKDYQGVADAIVHQGDAREWVKEIPDASLHWFHWDPPYGGREGSGGAFASEEGIDIDTKYCLTLMQEMIPEIHRVLQDGAWLAIWYTPVHYNWLRLTLQGHVFSDDYFEEKGEVYYTGTCIYCKKHIHLDYVWLSENYSCRKSPHRFWVNPFPNLWRKTDRHADGHEITRFLTKETEPFLYAGKNVDRNPTLCRTNHGNVFDFPLPVDRRHVNHKPSNLLKEILEDISVPGTVGGDAGVGSGSIIEATFQTGRKIVTAEIRETHVQTSRAIAVEELRAKGYGVKTKIADWLK